MIKEMDKERVMGMIKHEQSITDFFTGAGTGIVVSCLFSPNSTIRNAAILVGIVMISVGWYIKAKHDKKVIQYLGGHEDIYDRFGQFECNETAPMVPSLSVCKFKNFGLF